MNFLIAYFEMERKVTLTCDERAQHRNCTTPAAAVEGELIGQQRRRLGTRGRERSGLWHWRRLGFGCGELVQKELKIQPNREVRV